MADDGAGENPPKRVFVVDLPYDEYADGVAPQPISSQGDSFEAGGGSWDRWDLNPSQACVVAFDKVPDSSNHVLVPASTWTTFPVRAERVYYRLPTAGTTGTMSVRVFRWRT